MNLIFSSSVTFRLPSVKRAFEEYRHYLDAASGVTDVERKIGFFRWNYSWRGNYKESHWFRFQEAVKAHQRMAMKTLKPIFDKMDLVNL